MVDGSRPAQMCGRFARLVAAALAAGCTSNPYIIGAVASAEDGGDGGTGGDAQNLGVTFAADFDKSGASLLDPALALPAGALAPSLRLLGENASADRWVAESGAALSGAALARPALEAPFTDATRSVGLGDGSPTFTADAAETGAVDADDFALELVLRIGPLATLLDKRASANGWSVSTMANGALSLDLADGTDHPVVSEPLLAGAWYHCLFWVVRGAGGQAFCNGRGGAVTDLRALGSLASNVHLAVGGASAGTTQIAEIALFRAVSGGLGGVDGSMVSRQRFAALTGTLPRVARGTVLPEGIVRDAPAYLDLLREGSAVRQLFLVGPNWPRVACRVDANGTRDCGYLSEPERARRADPSGAAWKGDGVTVRADASLFADGESNMTALVPTADEVPHGLTWTGTYGASRQALSYFVRAGAGKLVASTVTNVGTVVFDVQRGAVVSAPAGALATVEPWGNGLFRCVLVFDAGEGEITYRIDLEGGVPFAGDGATPWVTVAGLQLDVGQSYAGSLLAAAQQAADQLTFAANDGNLPAGEAAAVGLRLMLPPGPRQNDQAVINLNQGGSYANQVQVFVRGNETAEDTGKLQFWCLRDNKTYWTFFHPTSAVDGVRHAIQVAWTATTAEMRVDGFPAAGPDVIPSPSPMVLDRIDLGFSARSSGSLEGLLAGLSIGEP
jgi:hypothetical protein